MSVLLVLLGEANEVDVWKLDGCDDMFGQEGWRLVAGQQLLVG